MPGIHVCRLVTQTSDRRGEYVVVANDGDSNVSLTGLEITDYTRTQQQVHIYRFPQAQGGGNLMLKPNQEAFVFTGPGTNVLSTQGDFLLYAGRAAPIWNNTGDVAFLRRLEGTFVDSLTVGDPPRHPNGH